MRLIDVDAIPYLLDRVAEKMVVTKDIIDALPTYEVHKIEKSMAVDNEMVHRYGHDEMISHIGRSMTREMLNDIANYTELSSTMDYKTDRTIARGCILVVVPPESENAR